MRTIAQSIVSWEWLVLLVLLPLFWFPENWRGLILLLIPFLWLLRKVVTGRFFPATPDDMAILVVVIAVLISFTAVFDIELSFPKIAGLMLGIALFFAGVQHGRGIPKGSYYLLSGIFITGSGLALAGLLASLENPFFRFLNPALADSSRIWHDLPLIGGLTVNPNQLAGMLCWIVPLLAACTIGLWQARAGWPSQWVAVLQLVLLAMLLINTFILLATRSRGGILSVLTALLTMLAIRFRWGKWLLLSVVLVVSSIIILTGLGVVTPVSVQWIDGLGLEGRLELWSSALNGLREFPLTGLSMNGFRELVHIFYPMISISPVMDISHAHNHLLQVGLDLGLPGLIAYLSLWIISAGMLWSAWHNSPSAPDRVFILGLSGSLTAGWMFGLLDAIALGAKPGFLWWLLLALVVVVWEQVPEKENARLHHSV